MNNTDKKDQLKHYGQKLKSETNQRKTNPPFQGIMGQRLKQGVKKGS